MKKLFALCGLILGIFLSRCSICCTVSGPTRDECFTNNILLVAAGMAANPNKAQDYAVFLPLIYSVCSEVPEGD